LVQARQCQQSTFLFTDAGRRTALPGDWIIQGENSELYIVDNAFFQRTFAPVPGKPAEEGRNYGC
jgi:hypothetical protein